MVPTTLPRFVRLFHAPTARVSLTVSATTLAVALAAPFAGLLADRVGRIAEGAALRLDVECLEAALQDIGPRWRVECKPEPMLSEAEGA